MKKRVARLNVIIYQKCHVILHGGSTICVFGVFSSFFLLFSVLLPFHGVLGVWVGWGERGS